MEAPVTEQEFLRGLDNVIVDKTQVSWLDGKNNKLYYRGYDVTELAAHSTFEETAYLLLIGHLPTERQLTAFSWKLHQITYVHEKIGRIIQEMPCNTHPLYGLQTALSMLACIESQYMTSPDESLLETSMRIIAQTPVILADIYRHNTGRPVIAPRSDLSCVENFLYMLTGKIPTQLEARCLQTTLILEMDNGFTTSTFVARAVASTLTNIYAATAAAVAALAGSLVGGTCAQVYEMLTHLKNASKEEVSAYVKKIYEKGEKLPGLGHRVYTREDPRANILEDMLDKLQKPKKKNQELELLRYMREEARPYHLARGEECFANVDFWLGAMYNFIGIHPMLYAAMTAAARVVGWTAHIMEMRSDNCLYRPRSLYTGPVNLPYIPLEQRKEKRLQDTSDANQGLRE